MVTTYALIIICSDILKCLLRVSYRPNRMGSSLTFLFPKVCWVMIESFVIFNQTGMNDMYRSTDILVMVVTMVLDAPR